MSFQIVIPSRRRPENMKAMLGMFPTALVLVDMCEKSEYDKVVPKNQLIFHFNLDRISSIRNYALDYCFKLKKSDCVVFVDDDLKCVRALVGRVARKIVEPDALESIFQASYQCAKDLGLSLFSYCRDARWALMAYLPHDPWSLTGPAAGAFGVIGDKIRFDESLVTREDVDLTLSSLLHDRITLHDRRFYFDFGRTWKGAGGNQGRGTEDNESSDVLAVKKKWKSYCSFTSRDHEGGLAMSIRVPRKNKVLTD